MNLFKIIIFIFRKKKQKNNDHKKRSKGKWRFSNAKRRLFKTKQPKKPVASTKPRKKIEIVDEIVAGQQPQLVIPPSKNYHKVKIPPQVKLVITGSVGAGKTTAIASLADFAPLTTEAKPTDEVSLLKSSTTTSMDYGTYHHSSKSKIHLYGTPGQKRFGFMGAVLTEGAKGLIILINNNQDAPLDDLNFYLTNSEKFLQSNPAVIGITHFDVNKTHGITEYIDFIGKFGMQWPIIPIDARKKSDVLKLVDFILDETYLPRTLEV